MRSSITTRAKDTLAPSMERKRARAPFAPRPFPVPPERAEVQGGATRSPDLYAQYFQRRSVEALDSAVGDTIQRTPITNALGEADDSWNTVWNAMGTLGSSYGNYENKIKELDIGGLPEKVGLRAAEGVKGWSSNYRNKAMAYLTELGKAITRSQGPRIAALGTDVVTEPDMFLIRNKDEIAAQKPGMFGGAEDHVEMKRTEGSYKDIQARTRDAVKQLIARQKKGARKYIAEIHAPLWYPNLSESNALRLWLSKYVAKTVPKFGHSGNFLNQLLVRIYIAQNTVPVTESKLIPQG